MRLGQTEAVAKYATGRTTVGAKSYSRIAVVIFAIVALLQLFRALSGWDIAVNGAAIPLWASWLAAVVGARSRLLGSPRPDSVPGDPRYRRLCVSRGGCSLIPN